MKMLFVGFVVLLFVSRDASAVAPGVPTVVYDPSASADRSLRAIVDRAHRFVVENKWVQNIRMLYQNYTASRDFYNTMTDLSKHRGGLTGHWLSRAESRLESTRGDFIWRMESYMKSDPEETAYVRNWMREIDEKVINMLDYSKEIRELGKERDKKVDKELERLTTPDASGKISSDKYDSAMLTAAMAKIEQLRLMNEHLALLLRRQQERDAAEWKAARQQKIERERKAKTHAEAYRYARDRRFGSRRDAMEVLKELPR